MVWRLVIKEKATLLELDRVYNLEDLYDLHEALDIVEALEEEAQNNNKR